MATCRGIRKAAPHSALCALCGQKEIPEQWRCGEKNELLVQNGLPEPAERQKQGGGTALSAARCVPSSERIVSPSKIHIW